MGIQEVDAHFVASAKALGAPLSSVCTLGRLNLFCSFEALNKIIAEYGFAPASIEQAPDRKGQFWAEDLFRLLSVEEIQSLDFSDYEDATLLHDMNQPLPASLKERFDLVYDGGTLEHIFNFPTALQNAMSMVRQGGALMLNTPINSLCGHGFYQFSPELFYRALSPENGFEIVRMLIHRSGKYYDVADPIEVHGRVMLIEGESTTLMVHAKRIDANAEIFATTPQQSDYVATWDDAEDNSSQAVNDGAVKAFLRQRLKGHQIDSISRRLQPWRQRRAVRQVVRNSKLSNSRLYKPVSIMKTRAPNQV